MPTQIGRAAVVVDYDDSGVRSGIAATSRAITAGIGGAASDAAAELQKVQAAAAAAATSAEKTAARVKSASRAEADALGRLRVEQTRLEELRAKGNVSASRMAAAEEALAKATRNAADAQRESAKAGSANELAQKRNETAMRGVEAATKRAGSAAETAARQGGSVGSNLSRGFDRAGVAADKFARRMPSVRDAVGSIAPALGAAAMVTGIRNVITAAGDLEQSAGGVQAVFKDQANTILAASKMASNSVGLSANAYNQLITVTGAMLKNQGIKTFAKDSQRLVQLGADLAAQYGGSTAQAVEALNASLRGENDPIQRYGITLNENAIKAEAFAKGIAKPVKDVAKIGTATARATVAQMKYNTAVKKYGKDSIQAITAEAQLGSAQSTLAKATEGSTGELSIQQKALATASLLFGQSADAAGAFSREAGTAQGKQQRLTAAIENQKTAIGEQLLPAYSALLDYAKGALGGISATVSFIQANAGTFQALALGVGAAAGAYAAIRVQALLAAAAQTVSGTAAMVASGQVTLFGAALRLAGGPVVAVIAAIGLLGAAIAYLWQNNETFRAGVIAVWTAVGGAVMGAWSNTIQPALAAFGAYVTGTLAPAVAGFWTGTVMPVFTAIGALVATVWTQNIWPALQAFAGFIMGTLVPAIVGFYQGTIVPIFAAIGSAVSYLWNNYVKPVFNAWVAFFQHILIPAFKFLYNNVVKPIFTLVVWQIQSAWALIKPILGLLAWTFTNILGPAISAFWTYGVKPVFEAIGKLISWTWGNVIKPALDAFSDAIKRMPEIFKSARDSIGKVWDGIRSIALKPVEFIVQTVLNFGLIKGINAIGKPFGVELPYIPWTAKLAAGGRVPGYSPNDVADNIPAMLTAGEFVMRRRSSRKLERDNPGALDYINRYGKLPAYAHGGRVFDSERPGRFMGGRTSPLRAGEYQHDQGVWRQLKGWLSANIPDARVTSAFRQTRTATGKISNHARGLAVDIVGSGRTSMMDIFNKLAATFGGRSIELIHSPAGGRQIMRGRPHMYSGVTRANHFDHVHWSMPSMDPNTPIAEGGGSWFNPFDAVKSATMAALEKTPGAQTFVKGFALGAPKALVEGASKWFADKATSVFGGGASDDANVARVADGPLRAMVQGIAAQRGWGSGAEWNALQWIVQHESGWNPNAQNPRSTAYGLFQFLNGTWAGVGARKSSDPQEQTMAGLRYIAQRYGTPTAAQRFWKANGHYGDGGYVESGQALAYGGRVRGRSRHKRADNIPARLTAGEYVHNVDAARYYGDDVMAAINARRVPIEAVAGYASGGAVQGVARGGSSRSGGRIVTKPIPISLTPVWPANVSKLIRDGLSKLVTGEEFDPVESEAAAKITSAYAKIRDAFTGAVKEQGELNKKVTDATAALAAADKRVAAARKTAPAATRAASMSVVNAQKALATARANEARARAAQDKAARGRNVKPSERAAAVKASAAATAKVAAAQTRLAAAQAKLTKARGSSSVATAMTAQTKARATLAAAKAAAAQNRTNAAASTTVGRILDASAPKMKKLADALAAVRDSSTWTSPTGTVVTGIAAMATHVEDLTKAAKDYAATISGAVTGKARLSDLWSQTADDGSAGASGPDVVIARMRALIEQTKQFGSVIATLRERGLNDAMLSQLRDGGLDSLDMAKAIADAQPETIAQFNDLQKQLQTGADALGKQFSDDVYSDQIRAADSVLAAWRGKEEALASQMRAIGTRMRVEMDAALAGRPAPAVSSPASRKLAAPAARVAANTAVTRQVMPSTLVVKDSDGALIGRMQVEAEKTTGKVLTSAVKAASVQRGGGIR